MKTDNFCINTFKKLTTENNVFLISVTV